MNLAKRYIGILGLGEAGMSAARWLWSQGADVVCIDDKPEQEWKKDFLSWCRQNDIETIGSCSSQKVPSSLELLVVSPGVPPYHMVVTNAVRKDIPVVGELYLASSLWKGPLVGITGTNGKTTTTLLTGHILEKGGLPVVRAGNISPPLFDLFHLNDGRTCGVLEISSFQLEYFPDFSVLDLKRPAFKAAVCLNVAPDHIDRHGSVEEYKRAKEHLFSFQEKDSVAVLGPGAEEFKTVADRVFLRDMLIDESSSTLTISLLGKDLRFDVSNWTLRGRHNMENLASAAVSAKVLGVGTGLIEKALSDFESPSHRMEEIGVFEGVTYFDDSKATNLHAVVSGLGGLSRPVVLIAGGRAKGEDFSRLGQVLSSLGNGCGPQIKGVVLVGESAHEMASGLDGFFQNICVIQGTCGETVMEEAVRKARTMAKLGDLIVLSPACASFDMFSSYRERGMAFKKAVKKIYGQER